MKVTWVEKDLTEKEVLDIPVEEAAKEYDEAETEAEVVPKEPIVEEMPSVSVDDDYVIQMPPRVIVEEERLVDTTMVGDVLRFSIQNATPGVWRKCYPAGFWIRDGKRLADPATKGQCVGDIRPGLTVNFVVVVPKFPLGDKPEKLRIAVLEDGVGWHTVEELRVR